VTNNSMISFDKYLFPLLPELIYCKDGDIKDELLFIEDHGGTFTLSFEKGMKCIDLIVASEQKDCFGRLQYQQGNKKLHFCYPLQSDELRPHMGFFHIEIRDDFGRVHILPGQLRISPPNKYIDTLKEYPVFKKLFCGISISPAELPP